MDKKKVNGGFSIRGAKKGGDGGRRAIESPDSLHSISYAKILDLISEGKVDGLFDKSNPLRSVYLNETPIQNVDGSLNFDGVGFDFREGTANQEVISGFESSAQPVLASAVLEYGTPVTVSITSLAASAARITLSARGLSQANTENGDINGYSVSYSIQVAKTRDGEFIPYVESAFTGKTTQVYQRSHRIDLPMDEGGVAPAGGWQVRIVRNTINSTSVAISDTTYVDLVEEVYDYQLRYPFSALAGLKINAKQFNSIPRRAYHMRGVRVRVPNNYNAETREYDETNPWNGGFKEDTYTNNPVWIYYDLLTNDRYGLGDRIDERDINVWELYNIAKYCDQYVPRLDAPGEEPRFTCNVYLQKRADAYKVIQDLTSVFRGMTYWGAGSVQTVADRRRDPVYTYTQSNVIDGRFTYSGTRLSDRATVAIVSYNDMSDFGRQKVVMEQDDDAVARFGVRELELIAFGCSSQSQAIRVARWALLTSQRETRQVTFSVGLDGTLVAPGNVVRISDSFLAGSRIGGRINSVSDDGRFIGLDSEIEISAGAGNKFITISPEGVVETRVIRSANPTFQAYTADLTTITADNAEIRVSQNGNGEINSTVIEVDPPYSNDNKPLVESIWTIEQDTLLPQLFTIVSVTELEGLRFEITAVQHVPGKFDNIDNGAPIDERPIMPLPSRVQEPPTNLALRTYEVAEQGVSSTTIRFSWEAPTREVNGVNVAQQVQYEVEWRRNDGNWRNSGRIQAIEYDLDNAYSGVYDFRVRAINSIEIPSIWVSLNRFLVDGKMDAPRPLISLTATTDVVFGINLAWAFDPAYNIIQRTEIYRSTSPVLNEADILKPENKLGDFAYPQNTATILGLRAGATFYFWGRVVDKNGEVSPLFPAGAGVMGQASSNADDILDYIANGIRDSELWKKLVEDITSGIEFPDIEWGEFRTRIERIEQEQANQAAVITRIQAQYNDVRAAAEEAISISRDTDGRLRSMWTIKTEVNDKGQRYLAGIGVGVEPNPNSPGYQSQVLVTADRFAVITGQTGQEYPEYLYWRSPFSSADPEQWTSDMGGTTEGPWDGTILRVRGEVYLRDFLPARGGERITFARNCAVYGDYSDYGVFCYNSQYNLIGRLTGQVLPIGNHPDTLDYFTLPSNTAFIRPKIWGAGFVDVRSMYLKRDRAITSTPQLPFVVEGGQVFIREAFIRDASITNAKIGDIIQSNNYVENQTGWQINKNGNIQINGNPANGRITIDAQGMVVYDERGVKRFQCGDLWR